MVYTNLLETEEWKSRRREIIERDNHKCQASGCNGKSKTLQVHHIDYISHDFKPWEYPNDMLLTVCQACHHKEQFRWQIEESLFTSLKMKGFLFGDIKALTTLIYTDKKFVFNLLHKLRKMQNG